MELVNKKKMIQTILKIASFFGVNKNTVSYILTIVITISLTIPTTLTIQSAALVKTTLDTVVVNQKRLETSISRVFKSVGERLDYLETRQNRFISVYLRSERIQNDVILESAEEMKLKYPVFNEKLKNLERMQADFLKDNYE